jgi:hypothetical protein
MKPTLNEQLARMQKLAGIIKENQGSNTNMLDFSSWKRIMGDDNIYQMVPPSKNTEEVLDIWVYPSKNKVMIASNDDIMIQTIADKYNSEVYQEMAPSIYQVNLKLTDLATLFPGQDFFLDDMNEGEGAYKDSKVSFGKFKNVEYYKVDNELYLVVTNSDNFKEIENSMDFGDRDYLKDKEKSFLNNTVDKLADEMSNYLTSIGVKNEVGDSPIGYGQEIDNLIVVIDPNDLSKLNNTQMSEGDTDYDRAKSAKRLGKKGEENIYGAGVKKGEKIEKEKMTKSKLKEQIKEMILAELNEDSTEDVEEPGALNNMYSPLGEAEGDMQNLKFNWLIKDEDFYKYYEKGVADGLDVKDGKKVKEIVGYFEDEDGEEDFDIIAYISSDGDIMDDDDILYDFWYKELNKKLVDLAKKGIEDDYEEEDEYEAEDDSSAESLYKMFKKYNLDNDRREYDAEDFMMAYPNLSQEEAEKLEDMLQNPLDEAKKDEEVEDVTVDDTEVVDAPASDMMAGESAEISGIQSNLQAAYAEAKALGDEKLITQIANTITYFTKAHILDTAPINENMFPMLKRILK